MWLTLSLLGKTLSRWTIFFLIHLVIKEERYGEERRGERERDSGNFIRVTSTVGQTTRYQASRMSTVRVPFPFPIANGSSRFFATPLDPSLWLSMFLACRQSWPSKCSIFDPRKPIQGNNYTGFYSGSMVERNTRGRWWERIVEQE